MSFYAPAIRDLDTTLDNLGTAPSATITSKQVPVSSIPKRVVKAPSPVVTPVKAVPVVQAAPVQAIPVATATLVQQAVSRFKLPAECRNLNDIYGIIDKEEKSVFMLACQKIVQKKLKTTQPSIVEKMTKNQLKNLKKGGTMYDKLKQWMKTNMKWKNTDELLQEGTRRSNVREIFVKKIKNTANFGSPMFTNDTMGINIDAICVIQKLPDFEGLVDKDLNPVKANVLLLDHIAKDKSSKGSISNFLHDVIGAVALLDKYIADYVITSPLVDETPNPNFDPSKSGPKYQNKTIKQSDREKIFTKWGFKPIKTIVNGTSYDHGKQTSPRKTFLDYDSFSDMELDDLNDEMESYTDVELDELLEEINVGMAKDDYDSMSDSAPTSISGHSYDSESDVGNVSYNSSSDVANDSYDSSSDMGPIIPILVMLHNIFYITHNTNMLFPYNSSQNP